MGQTYKVIKGASDVAPPQAGEGSGSIPASGSAPVIFLDVDGVLNNHASLAQHCHLLPEKVLLLRILCDLTDAKIVISSAWRSFMRENEERGLCPFRFAMHKAGFPTGRILGRTTDGYQARGTEVNEWLMEHKPQRWVIIDDEAFNFMEDEVQAQRFVQTDGAVGLTWCDCQKALGILGRNTD